MGDVYSPVFNEYFSTIFDVPDSVLDSRDISEKKMYNETCPLWISFIMGGRGSRKYADKELHSMSRDNKCKGERKKHGKEERIRNAMGEEG